LSTVNDEAWARYISSQGIKFDQPSYRVNAEELKKITQREPRLLAKFDTPSELATPIREAGYTLLPVRNGEYLLVRGTVFVTLPPCEDHGTFQPNLPFPLRTSSRSEGEAQYIDTAFNTGLLQHFLGIDPMYLTIRGRERTKPFQFQLSGIAIDTSSVQIEVDGGYEALSDIVLVEAKIGLPDQFNVRQLYYPFRYFSDLVPEKTIRTIFMACIPTSTQYYLYEYVFPVRTDPLSARAPRCGLYRLLSPQSLTIYTLLDAKIQSRNNLAPQADDLIKVFELLTAVDAGISTSSDVADYFIFDPRQSSYYREAAEYLGLITTAPDGAYELTELGLDVVSRPPIEQPRALAEAVVNSWIFVDLIKKVGSRRVIIDADIEALIATAKKRDGSRRYNETTTGRRRQTIVAWIKWLASEIGCFSIEPDGYHLR
jgi:hypothetical protein